MHPSMTSEFPDSKYLSFELDDHYEGKTERVIVTSKKRLAILGEIKWFGRWRQYAFFPEADTVWNPECMDDVQACVAILKERREVSQRSALDKGDGSDINSPHFRPGYHGP